METYYIIHSVQEYVDLIDREKKKTEDGGNKSDFLFRGQIRDLPLLPKLARLKPRGEIENIEELIIKEFHYCPVIS